MRFVFAVLGALFLAQCASGGDDDRFVVGQSPRAFIILGVAEASENTSARYQMLWRRLDANGAFLRLDDDNAMQAETNRGDTLRVRGIPGEFILAEIDPGVYALDSVFGAIREGRVDYVANGIITGPERPAFEVRPGEAIYLGIWQVDIVDSFATTRLWRLDEADLRAVMHERQPFDGGVRIRETEPRAVACSPHRVNTISQRQVC